MFIGKGSSAVRRSFKATRAELYCYWAGYGGLYKLSCCKSLALVKGEGEASGACADRAYADGAYMDRACVDRVYADRACADGACVNGACVDRAYMGRVYIDRVCAD